MSPRGLVLILLMLLQLVGVRGLQAEVVEEIVAVVDTLPLLASDLELAKLVELEQPSPGESPDVYRARLLDSRIRLELEFCDLEASGVVSRLEIDTEAVLAMLIDRGGGRESLGDRLAIRGLTWTEVEELALRIAVVQAYVEQRLRPQVHVLTEEIEAAYQSEVVAALAGLEAPPPPLAEVSEGLYQLLAERHLNAEIERWLEHARERHDVTRFHP